MSYNDVMDYLSRNANCYDGEYWAFQRIVGHQHVHQGHPDYKGSSYNLRILWKNGEETIESLKEFAEDTCAIRQRKEPTGNRQLETIQSRHQARGSSRMISETSKISVVLI